MVSNKVIKVEVAYALPNAQAILPVTIDEGTTALAAAEQSGVVKRFPDIDLAKNKLGIFGKAIKPDHILQENDRVEIYRPLLADPKEVRKRRAAKAKG